MKKALLLVTSFAVYGLQAQVGINTTNPEKTLDVNGEVKVRTLKNNPSPEKVVVVSADNVLSTAPLSAAGGVVISGGGSGTYTVGKTYTCNYKNRNKTIWLQQGAITCTYSSNHYWEYNGTVTVFLKGPASYTTGIQNAPEGTPILGTSNYSSDYQSSVTSGYSYALKNYIGNNNAGVTTFPLRVIDDSQYKP